MQQELVIDSRVPKVRVSALALLPSAPRPVLASRIRPLPWAGSPNSSQSLQHCLLIAMQNYSANTPRSIRHRLSVPKQPAPMGIIMPSFRQDGPCSTLAVNTNSGRHAYGPW